MARSSAIHVKGLFGRGKGGLIKLKASAQLSLRDNNCSHVDIPPVFPHGGLNHAHDQSCIKFSKRGI